MTARARIRRATEIGLAALLVAAAGAALVWGAERLPLLDTLVFGYDWHNYWLMLRGGWPDYGAADVFNPPWTLLLLLPLGALPFKTGWAVLTLATLGVLVLSVPPRAGGRPDVWATLALLFCFWTLRHLADGNLAALTVGGFLLLLEGWRRGSSWRAALGVLLAAAKPQESALALAVLAVFMLKTWPARRWASAAGGVLLVVVPSLALLGADWMARLLPSTASGTAALSPSMARTFTNISLTALAALGVPAWARAALWLVVLGVTVVLAYLSRWEFSRTLAGLLVAAGLLLSPYSNGTSLAPLIAVGVVPLLRARPRLGWALMALGYAPFLTPVPNTASGWPETWQMLFVVLVWAALSWHQLHPPLSPHRRLWVLRQAGDLAGGDGGRQGG